MKLSLHETDAGGTVVLAWHGADGIDAPAAARVIVVAERNGAVAHALHRTAAYLAASCTR